MATAPQEEAARNMPRDSAIDLGDSEGPQGGPSAGPAAEGSPEGLRSAGETSGVGVSARAGRRKASIKRDSQSDSSSPSSESDWTDVSSFSSRRDDSLGSSSGVAGSKRRRRRRRRSNSGLSWRCLPSVSSFGDPSELSSCSFPAATASSSAAELLLGSLAAGVEGAAAAAAAAAAVSAPDSEVESLWGDAEEDRWAFDLDVLLAEAAADPPELDVMGALDFEGPASAVGGLSASLSAFAATRAETAASLSPPPCCFLAFVLQQRGAIAVVVAAAAAAPEALPRRRTARRHPKKCMRLCARMHAFMYACMQIYCSLLLWLQAEAPLPLLLSRLRWFRPSTLGIGPFTLPFAPTMGFYRFFLLRLWPLRGVSPPALACFNVCFVKWVMFVLSICLFILRDYTPAELLALLAEHREAWIASIVAQRMLQHEISNSSSSGSSSLSSSSRSSLLFRLADIRSLCLLHLARNAAEPVSKA
ncbi:hypothetical protein Efla_007589 [Eimeria flavescens]